jgi:hypothetical protein
MTVNRDSRFGTRSAEPAGMNRQLGGILTFFGFHINLFRRTFSTGALIASVPHTRRWNNCLTSSPLLLYKKVKKYFNLIFLGKWPLRETTERGGMEAVGKQDARPALGAQLEGGGIHEKKDWQAKRN